MKQIGILLALAAGLTAAPAFCQNSVNLLWQASSDAASNPSLTYNVYRASTCAGPFSKLNASGISETTFLDTSVAIGTAYCYRVTALLSGAESAPSNTAVAVVPPAAGREAACAHRGPLIGWIRCIGGRPKASPSKPITR